uniref:Putative ovule protein n=1 Tax=Solanum chacoense TaxID=4108 RepID=A0A0V0HAL6_SOLCH
MYYWFEGEKEVILSQRPRECFLIRDHLCNFTSWARNRKCLKIQQHLISHYFDSLLQGPAAIQWWNDFQAVRIS